MSDAIDNYFNTGLMWLEAGEYAAAIESLTKALRLSLGDMAEVYLYRGEAYAFLEQWEAALADFNEALRLRPTMAEAYNERGNLYRFQNQPQTAINDYSWAIRCDPGHYEAYYNRALAYESLDELAQAEIDLTETLRINPGTALAYEARGRVRAAQRNYDGAIEDYQRYLRMGGGREYDNHSEIQSHLISMRLLRFFRRVFRLT